MEPATIANIVLILISIGFLYWGIRRSWWLLVLLGVIGLFYAIINLIF